MASNSATREPNKTDHPLQQNLRHHLPINPSGQVLALTSVLLVEGRLLSLPSAACATCLSNHPRQPGRNIWRISPPTLRRKKRAFWERSRDYGVWRGDKRHPIPRRFLFQDDSISCQILYCVTNALYATVITTMLDYASECCFVLDLLSTNAFTLRCNNDV